MPSTVTCVRCGETRAGFERPPFPGPIGARNVARICQE
jgi:Fe-S cluster biosynthesis and repair protein YggX